jgi:hypothetical protein
MGTITNNFETGHTSGTAITAGNSGDGTAGTAFTNAAFTGTGTYDSDSAHGSLAAKIVTGTAGTNVMQYGSGVLNHNSPTFYTRFYMKWGSLPSSTTRLIKWEGGASALIAEVDLTSAGLLRLLDSTGATIVTFVNAISTGFFVRVEFDITIGTSTGTIAARLYNSMDSVTPTETQTFSSQNLSANGLNFVQFGQTVTVGTSETFSIDDFAISDIGPQPPVGPQPPPGDTICLGGITL